jgi:hypothetical protein
MTQGFQYDNWRPTLERSVGDRVARGCAAECAPATPPAIPAASSLRDADGGLAIPLRGLWDYGRSQTAGSFFESSP